MVGRSQAFLRQVQLNRTTVPSFDAYPFNIPAIGALDKLRFDRPVTFFVGENGAGKSTLLEAIAVAFGLNAEGGSRNFTFESRASHADLSRHLKLERSFRRVADSFFLRAESYFNLATEVDNMDAQASYGGASLHEQSHGESFFALFTHRFRPSGFYLLDEPEAALSPSRQLSFLTRLHDLVGEGCQFIIATHSPILMAYPDADIVALADGPPQKVKYRDTEHYIITRNFLARTEQMLDVLLDRRPDAT